MAPTRSTGDLSGRTPAEGDTSPRETGAPTEPRLHGLLAMLARMLRPAARGGEAETASPLPHRLSSLQHWIWRAQSTDAIPSASAASAGADSRFHNVTSTGSTRSPPETDAKGDDRIAAEMSGALLPLAGAGLAIATLALAVVAVRAGAIIVALSAALFAGMLLVAVPVLAMRRAVHSTSTSSSRRGSATGSAIAFVEEARDDAFAMVEAAAAHPTGSGDTIPIPPLGADAKPSVVAAPTHADRRELPPALPLDIGDIVVECDSDGQVVALNDCAATLLGAPPAAIIGRSFSAVAADLQRAPAVAELEIIEPATRQAADATRWDSVRQTLLSPSGPRNDGSEEKNTADPAPSSPASAVAPEDTDANAAKPREAIPPLLGDVEVGGRWYAFRHDPVLVDGEAIGWRAVGRDVTDRKATEAALRVAREKAEAANAAKSRFLAMVSHEIRTPLNGILGMTGLLMMTPLTPEQRTYARAVETSGEALLLLIEDLLDFAKIEAGRLDLSPRPTPLAATIEELVELLAPRATAKGIELAAYIDPRLPEEVHVDPARLKQVLFNLAGNGIKFTAEGGVAVEAWVAGPPDETGAKPVLFQVRDTGIGVAADDAERIFREFEQAEPGPARSFGGTGLGLAIARQLVRLMGGDIQVDSRPGAGACFSFTVSLLPVRREEPDHDRPTEPPAAAKRLSQPTGARAAQERLFAIFGDRGRPAQSGASPSTVPEHSIAGRRIMLVSHAMIEAPFLLRRLFDAGAEVTLVTQREIESGLAQGEAADIVLVDAAAGDPIALIDRVRSVSEVPACILIDPRERPLLPELQAAGYGAYLVKPVRGRSLTAAIAMLTGAAPFTDIDTGGEASATAIDAAARPGRPARVLLCDDNEINLLLGRGLLERLGAEVTVATGGRSAVRAVLDRCEAAEYDDEAAERCFDLVLMDLHMPEMDGVEAARRIRSRMGAAAPMIVALTADVSAETREAFEVALFDAWLAKPLMPESLETLLADLAARQSVQP